MDHQTKQVCFGKNDQRSQFHLRKIIYLSGFEQSSKLQRTIYPKLTCLNVLNSVKKS